jgi:two-component system sensor histidine kinase BaeS
MVAVVAGALAVAGLGSLLFARNATARNDRAPLLAQATNIAAVIDKLDTAVVGSGQTPLRRVTRDARVVVGSTEPIDCAYFIIIGPQRTQGTLVNEPSTSCGPAGGVIAQLTDADMTALTSNETVSFVRGDTAYAYVPLDLAGLGSRTIVVALVKKGTLPPSTGLYFLVAAGLSLVVAAVVAVLVARRITRPIAVAAATTAKMAAGDLDARVPVSPGDYPELVSLATAINSMAEGLSRARGQERQFLLSISHDLRTPLTSIRGYAESLLDGATDDPHRAAAVILSEAGRLERLIADLLDLARLDAQRFAIDVRRTDLDEVARTSADGLRLALSEAGVAIDVPDYSANGAGHPVIVVADPDRLAQVVANLVDNASRFATSSVRVATSTNPAESGTALLVVEDDGPGIDPADLPHIFERFYTSDRRSGTAARGSGLGLAIVSELVGAMGGSVRAVSPVTPTGGTRIEIRLRAWQP